MGTKKSLAVAKTVSIIGFAMLLICTYGLRSEVLKLNRIKFSADEEIAINQAERYRETHPQRVAAHVVELKQHEMQKAHYERQMEHYNMLIELQQADLEEYSRLSTDGGLEFPPLPRVPRMPSPPEPPGIQDRLVEINTKFAAQRFHYFDMTAKLTWVACIGAIALAGGLMYLLMFDVNGSRVFYVIILLISFVFMIGPSFHTIMSAIVGFLQMPT